MHVLKPEPPNLTVEMVVFQLIDGKLHTLIGTPMNYPDKDARGIAGGFCAKGETTLQALATILDIKMGLDIKQLGLVEQLYTFDSLKNEAQELEVNVTYLGLGERLELGISKTNQSPMFVDMAMLPTMAYDHKTVIEYALQRLRSKLVYTTAISALLPPLFTISTLHAAYETILGHALDIHNFRKKFLSYEVLEATDEMYTDGAHRPARYYKFKQTKLQNLNRDFE